MNHALLFLAARSLRNGALRAVGRLREPRYLLALIAGVGWLAYLGRHGEVRASGPPPDVALVLAAAGVFVTAAWSWVLGGGARALGYSAPEVTWLLPAPIPRRALVDFKLLRLQPLLLGNALLWSLLVPAASTGGSIRRGIGIWVLLGTLAMHRILAGVVRGQYGGTRRRGRLLGAIVGGTLFAVALAVAAGTGDTAGPAWSGAPLLRAVLWPASLLVRPVLLTDAGAWLASLPAALALLALHYGAVHLAEGRAGDRAALQALAQLDTTPGAPATDRPGGVPVVALAASGSAAGAIVWKNVTMLLRRGRLLGLTAAWLAALVGLALVADEHRGGAGILGAFALVWGALLLLGGPQFLRNDLRSDLDHLALLKTLPLPAASLVGAELRGAILTLGSGVLALLSVAYVALRAAGVIPPEFQGAAWVAGGALAVGGVVTLVVLVQNAAALLLPGWVRLTGRTGSASALGANLLGVLLTLAAVGTLLAPVRPVVRWLLAAGTSWSPVAAGLAVLGLAVAECALVLPLLGRLFERMEPIETPER